jgi:2-phospho-L-lactate guanylyltransferase
MALRIIIPVKPFTEAKQRLGSVLNDRARAELAQSMFQHVFATALRSADAHAVMVVSRGQDVLDFAAAQGAVGVAENGRSDLNAALAQAAEFASEHGASKFLVVASDLPLLREDDLARMFAEVCAIAPDRRGRGTNALTWPAYRPWVFAFGENSFERHFAAARDAGFDPKIITSPGLAHDVDVPDDLLFKPLA